MANENELPPKHAVWQVRYTEAPGIVRARIVIDLERGLTAAEAWQRSRFPGNPAFSSVVLIPVVSWPCPAHLVEPLKLYAKLPEVEQCALAASFNTTDVTRVCLMPRSVAGVGAR